MAGARVVVHYEDGTSQEFNPNKPRLLLDMERKFNIQSPEKHEHILWLAHHALAKDGESFDDWVDRVDDFEATGGEDKKDEDAEGKAPPS